MTFRDEGVSKIFTVLIAIALVVFMCGFASGVIITLALLK